MLSHFFMDVQLSH